MAHSRIQIVCQACDLCCDSTSTFRKRDSKTTAIGTLQLRARTNDYATSNYINTVLLCACSTTAPHVIALQLYKLMVQSVITCSIRAALQTEILPASVKVIVRTGRDATVLTLALAVSLSKASVNRCTTSALLWILLACFIACCDAAIITASKHIQQSSLCI
jgi:hypothetical protein